MPYTPNQSILSRSLDSLYWARDKVVSMCASTCCVSTDCAGFDYGYVSHNCLLDSLQPIWPLRPQTPDINKTLPLHTSAVCRPWIVPCKLQRWLWCPEIRADQQQLVERLRPTSAAPTAVFAMCDPLFLPHSDARLWTSTTYSHRVHMPSFLASDWLISFQSYQVIENPRYWFCWEGQ